MTVFKPKIKLKTSRGQISVLVILSLIPLFTLFAFAVNIGMLVHTKMSLQNAADLAAIAGAATQARQMTAISHLNYEMRQAYKRFLFKYYVIGNLSLKCFPRSSGVQPGCTPGNDSQDFNFENLGNTKFPGLPVVCVVLSRNSNPCQQPGIVPKVVKPQCLDIDPVCGALKQAADAIRDVQNASCGANSFINQELVSAWLYSTGQDEEELKADSTLSGLVQGLGLVIEEVLLKSRIESLVEYINEKPRAGITQQSFRSEVDAEQDQPRLERTVMAFQTAIGNLNEKVFREISMTELLPKTPMLTLSDIRQKFQVPFITMDGQDSEKCSMIISPVGASPVLGVYANRGSHVYYAVKLTAKAKILFNPFPIPGPSSEITMTAYAAAQPFGSRIGPEITPERAKQLFTRDFKEASGEVISYPYLKMGVDSDDDGIKKIGVIKALHGSILSSVTSNGIPTIDIKSFNKGMRAMMIPDQAELGLYNIPVDVEREHPNKDKHEMVRYFSPDSADPEANYTFWAPLISPRKNISQLKDKLQEEVMEGLGVFSLTGNTSTRPQDQQNLAIARELIDKLDKLFNSKKLLRNVASMQDPLGKLVFDSNSGSGRPNVPFKFNSGDLNNFATSFSTLNDQGYHLTGRDGYSVKLIPFRMLISTPGEIANQGSTRVGKWISKAPEFGPELPELSRVEY